MEKKEKIKFYIQEDKKTKNVFLLKLYKEKSYRIMFQWDQHINSKSGNFIYDNSFFKKPSSKTFIEIDFLKGKCFINELIKKQKKKKNSKKTLVSERVEFDINILTTIHSDNDFLSIIFNEECVEIVCSMRIYRNFPKIKFSF